VGIGGIVGVFLVALPGDFGLSGWGGTSTVEDGTSGAGVSSNVNQSSSSASVLVSVEIPGARKLCSQWGQLTRLPAALSEMDTEPLHRGH
jgi:hypothetical protein